MISPRTSRSTARARAAAVVAIVLGALATGGVAAIAQTPPITLPGQTTTTTTTTTTAPPSEPQPQPQPQPSPIPNPQPEPAPPGEPPPPGEEPAPAPAPGPAPFPGPGQPAPTPSPDQPQEPLPEVPPHEGDGDAPTTGAGGFPPDLARLRDSVVRTPANNTRALLDSLQPLRDMGVPEDEILRVGMGRFIVAGYASYSHDWWFPRFGPGWRLHKGTDVFAEYGTGVRAPVDGRVRITNGGLGGISVYVVEPSGTYWYLTHLSGIAPGLVEGASVTTGQIVGFIGTSGNARGTPPHVHVEIHPGGGEAVDPKLVLDTFIADAAGQVPQIVTAYQASRAATTATGSPVAVALPPLSTLAAPILPTPAGGPSRAALLYVSAMSPAGGALQLAGAEAARAAAGIDWAAQLRSTLVRDELDALAGQRARAVLEPLTPPALQASLNRLGF